MNELAKLDVTSLKNLEQISSLTDEVIQNLEQSENQIVRAAYMAKGIAQLKKLLPDDLVKAFASLQNSPLGFKTDDKRGYSLSILRDCLIESFFNQVNIVGNEFNIIASGFYITKEGFQGKMRRDSRWQDVKIQFGIPKIDQESKRAIVSFKAQWKYNGKSETLEDQIAIKWHPTTGDDAIIGKAERKIRSRMWAQSTGNHLPDGDAIEVRAELIEQEETQYAPESKPSPLAHQMRAKLQFCNISEIEFIRYLHEVKLVDESLSSLEDMEEAATNTLKDLLGQKDHNLIAALKMHKQSKETETDEVMV